MGMGLFGLESRLQTIKHMGPTPDEVCRTFVEFTHWRVDAQWVSADLDKSATTVDWLEQMGVEFEDASAYFPEAAMCRTDTG